MRKQKKPLGVVLRRRLERALARETYFVATAPSVEWLRTAAPVERRAWSESAKQLGSWMVDERGEPYPTYVVSLERYVDALGRAFESERDTIAALLAEKSTEAGAAFKKLVDAGANPVWIAEECLHLRPRRLARPLNRDPRRRNYVRAELKSLSRRFESLAGDYRTFIEAAREIGLGRVRQKTVTLLVEESRLLDRQVMRMTERGPSEDYYRYIALAEHLKLTTGALHDADVCKLLDAVRPKKKGELWSVGALEQYRVRDKRGDDWLRQNHIAGMVDDQLEKRRSEKTAENRDA